MFEMPGALRCPALEALLRLGSGCLAQDRAR